MNMLQLAGGGELRDVDEQQLLDTNMLQLAGGEEDMLQFAAMLESLPGTSAAAQRSEWTHAEDTFILARVAQNGGKGQWRHIATQMPGRSDDAVRNRWDRLEAWRLRREATGAAPHLGRARSIKYLCSRCGQPKKDHNCMAREAPSNQEIKAKKSAAGEGKRITWTPEEDAVILQHVRLFGTK